jgi:formate hydrogenlyase regulatory protein HycA
MGFYALDDGNQFWGRVVVTFCGVPEPSPDDWEPYRRWSAVLHKFDPRGKHIGTELWSANATADEEAAFEQASAKLDEMVAALGPVEYGDIEIKLFEVEIDGEVFGLIDVSDSDEGPEFAERVEMHPGGLLFTAPWDGNYDT